ncbi:hypothetical protein D5b_00188 [Faustovirus]|nr:hypothetical protein D5b_00188 [Faustovirus]AMN84725.1 hypothetical protein D6_00323 [Faustovirus]AMP44142.1 hypothetical protein PRJ_Dakar_00186 [Faustovirus]QKE50410.1 A1l transcription factor/late transcription factor VLTF-2 [Faustovirus]
MASIISNSSTLVETVKSRFLIHLFDISKQNIINIYSSSKTTPPTQSTASAAYTPIPLEIYKSLPARFTSLQNWPTSCNLKCWTCDRMFNTRPLFAPTDPQPDGSYAPEGVFGDWPCVARYIEDYHPDQKYVYNALLLDLHYIFTGIRVEKIPLGYRKTIMKQYCGELGVSLTEFDDMTKALMKNCTLMAKTTPLRKLE